MDNYTVERMHLVQQLWRVEDLHERLLLTMQQSVYTDWWRDIEQYARHALSEPLPALGFELFRQFEDDGQRIPYEQVYFERRGRLGALALMLLRLEAEHQRGVSIKQVEQYEVSVNGAEQHRVSINEVEQHGMSANGAEQYGVNVNGAEHHTENVDQAKRLQGVSAHTDVIGNDAESGIQTEHAQMWDRNAVLTALEEALWDLCGEYTWCLPAHIPAESHTPAWQEIDLFTAETAGMLAELSILLNGVIDRRIIKRMQLEIRRRVLDVLMDEERHWGWETAEHNWSAVCASGCGIAALLVEQHDGRKPFILKRVFKALDYFLNGYGDDGGCAEGMGYWVYGFGYFTYLIDMLEATGYPVQFNEAQQRKIRAIAAFPQAAHLSSGVFVNFSDSEERQTLPTGLLSRLAQQQGGDIRLPFELPLFSEDHCHRWAHLLRDLLWSEPERWNTRSAVPSGGGTYREVEQATVCQASVTVSSTQFRKDSVARDRTRDSSFHRKPSSDDDRNEQEYVEHVRNEQDDYEPILAKTEAIDNIDGKREKTVSSETSAGSHYWPDLEWLVVSGQVGFAAKGGHNDEPHNHNDLGSFIIHGGEHNLLCDPGAGMYTQAYFAPGREAILHISSAGHSVPCVNGMEQQSGRDHKAVVLGVQQRAQSALLELELAAAYPEAAGLQSLTRRFHWQMLASAEPAIAMAQLDVYDRFLFKQPIRSAVNDTGAHQATGEAGIPIRERFMSRIKPQLCEHSIIWEGKQALVRLDVEKGRYEVDIEELASHDHEGQPITLYRTNLMLTVHVHEGSNAGEMDRSTVDAQAPNAGIQAVSIAASDGNMPILASVRTQTCMDINNSISLREGNKVNGRVLSTAIYNNLLLRRLRCDPGVHPFIPSRKGRIITKSLRIRPDKKQSIEPSKETSKEPSKKTSKEPGEEQSKQPNVIKLEDDHHLSVTDDRQQKPDIHCMFTFTVISQV